MDKLTQIAQIPKLTRCGHYQVTVDWDYVEQWIADKSEGMSLELDPDFQRGHVWNTDKQIKYVEFILRGGDSSKILYFNCPGWMTTFKGPMQLVDGKQRLEAVLAFLRGDIPAFGSYLSEWEPRMLRMSGAHFLMNVNDLKKREEVLQWYLDLNSGGVVHTEDELNKVRVLLEEEKAK